jgi:hypothetical protein
MGVLTGNTLVDVVIVIGIIIVVVILLTWLLGYAGHPFSRFTDYWGFIKEPSIMASLSKWTS